MKKVFMILLVLVMVFMLGIGVFATEVATEQPTDAVQGEVISNENEVEDASVVSDENKVEDASAVGNTDTTGIGASDEASTEPKEDMYLLGKVIEVGEIVEEDVATSYYSSSKENVQKIKVKVLNGTTHKDKEVEISYPITANEKSKIINNELKVGQKVYLAVQDYTDENGQETTYGQIIVVRKDNVILLVAIILAVILLVFSIINGLKTIGIILLNTVITIVGFLVLYFLKIPAMVSLAIISLLVIISNMLVLQKISKQTWVTILAIVLSTVITFGALILITNFTGINNSSSFDMSLTQEEIDSAKEQGVTLKLLQVKYFDVMMAIMIIASLGITMDIAITSCKKAKLGKSFMETLKDVSSKLPKRLNTVYLIVLGIFLIQFIQAKASYGTPLMLLFNDNQLFVEAIKLATILINPIIVVPITVLLSRELLDSTKEIEEPKKED